MNIAFDNHNTLVSILNNRIKDEKGITFINGSHDEHFLPYSELYRKSLLFLNVLQKRGLKPGSELIIQIEDNREFLIVFWASLIGKIIPIPLSIGTQNDHKNKLVKVWQQMADPHIICDDLHLKRIAEFCTENDIEYLANQILQKFISRNDLDSGTESGIVELINPEDIAYIQYSSGSTGDPKGVVLTHQNLITNVTDIIERSQIESEDSMLSWMPLTHDMGLICFHLSGVLANINQYIIPTSLFIRNPVLWIDKASEHAVSLLYSPNFGYQYFHSAALSSKNLFNWNLSAVRLIYNGAEPISKNICFLFLDFLNQYGLKNNVMFPGYGLAEACVAVTLPVPAQELKIHNIKRNSLKTGYKVAYADNELDKDSISFIEVGYPVNHCSVRITDDDGNVLEQEFIGNIEIKGNNVTAGYYRDDVRTAQIKTADKWLKTQDIGLLKNGKLIITGRKKNIIIINGQNYYPHDIEKVVYEAIASEIGKVVACGLRNDHIAREELLIFVLHKGSVENFLPISSKIKQSVARHIGIIADKVVAVRKIPKTTSGKVQNYKLLEMYADGFFQKQIDEIEQLSQLSLPLFADSSSDYAGIRALTAIVTEIFGINVEITDNIIELGINSLKAVKLSSAINTKFKVNISLQDILDYPTIELLAACIAGKPQTAVVKIGKAPESETYDLCFEQHNMLMLNKLDTAGSSLNIAVAKTIKGNLDITALFKAVNVLVSRHESLRTIFVETASGPRQKIINNEQFNFKVNYVPLFNEADSDLKSNFIANQEACYKFDLSTGPLLRITLIGIEEDQYILVLVIHHIISDGWSIVNLLNELFENYSNAIAGQPILVDQLQLQYKDYAYWRNENITNGNLADAKKYWLNELNAGVAKLNLPYKTAQKQPFSFKGSELKLKLTEKLSADLELLSKKQGVTLFMSLLAVVKLLLYKYTSQNKITVGTDIAGRDFDSLENQIGYYLNTLIISTELDKDDTFSALLKNVKNKTLSAFENQFYPVNKAISDLSIQKDSSSLFNVLVIFQNFYSGIKCDGTGLTLHDYDLNTTTSLTDIHFEFFNQDGVISLNLKYNTDLFDAWQIENLSKHFVLLIKQVVLLQDNKIDEYDPFYEEKRTLAANNKSVKYPDQTIIDLLCESAIKHTEKIAIVCNGNNITYADLHSRSNHIADKLLNKALKRGDSVGLMMQRSEHLIIALIAILKAGLTYVYIDPEYPAERIKFIIEDSNIKLLFTDEQTAQAGAFDIAVLKNELFNNTANNNIKPVLAPINGDDLAYIMYTSGTTGVPKGVMIEHQSLFDYVNTFINYFNVAATDVVVQQSSLSFDISIEEIFPVLCTGGKLVILKNGGHDIDALVETAISCEATILSVTPLIIKELNKFSAKLNHLRVLISGGDRLKANYIDNLIGHIDLYNTYGPTESTVCATYNKIETLSEAAIIGKPIVNRTVYILDEAMRVVPHGITGEIYIGGKGLAKGYKNQPQITTTNFVKSPFDNNVRLFKTGDIARWLDNGKIEIIGRKDAQVKVRGYRIETGEIESTLLTHSAIDDAYVLPVEAINDEKYLIAYYIVKQNCQLNAEQLKRHLYKYLPAYMVPAHFVALDTFPKTTNGKIDVLKLPVPETSLLNIDDTEMLSEMESAIILLWKNILEKEEIGLHQNFFELGGNSIKATRLATQLQKQLNKKILFTDIFNYNTVYELANFLNSQYSTGAVLFEKAPKEKYYDLSHNQKRLWLLDQFQDTGTAYDLSFAFKFCGEVDIDAFEKSFNALLNRHESLRTVFKLVNGEPKQFIYEADVIQFIVEHRYVISNKSGHEISSLSESFFKEAFSLEKWPLFRVRFIHLNKNEHIFLFKIHHIIADGWSVEIIANELSQLYNSFKMGYDANLPQLAHQYKDFSVWQKKNINSNESQQSHAYWIQQFNNELPPLELPVDYPRPKEQSYNGGTFNFSIDNDLKNKLLLAGNANGAGLFFTLLASVNALLYRYTGVEDITIGVPVSGRSHHALTDQIGFFLNTIALRTKFSGKESFEDLLKKVNEIGLKGFAHQDYPYDLVIDDLKVEGGGSSLFDVMVGFQNKENALNLFSNLNGIEVTPYKVDKKTSQFDLSIDFFDLKDGIDVEIEYNSDLFSNTRIQRLAQHLTRLIEIWTEDLTLPVNEIDYITDEEKNTLLNTFNDTNTVWGKELTFQQIFENQVESTGNLPAVIFNERQLSYHELNEKANQLAFFLRLKYHIKANDRVGLIVDRSEMMLVYVWGIIKAGAVFVPIDPDYPVDRINFVIEDSEIKVLLTDKTIAFTKDVNFSEIIKLDRISAELAQYPVANPINVNKTNDILYIIYTSGSTGRPKGVIIEHNNVFNIHNAWRQAYSLDKFKVNLLQVASMAFDVFMGDVCRSLLNGGCMVVCPADMRIDPESMFALINKHQINILESTPSLLMPLMNYVADNQFDISFMKMLILGSETCLMEDYRKLLNRYGSQMRIINSYGTTETTIDASFYEQKDEKLLSRTAVTPIGKPLQNIRFYILDNYGQLVPAGIDGELYIGGSGVGRGYLNRSDLNNEKFITDKFTQKGKLYKTGDIARWQEDGNIIYKGRKDFQVKIRGHRIEIGEIEQVLLSHSGVSEVQVITVKEGEDLSLAAYVVLGGGVLIKELRSWLSERVPHYMVPSYFVGVSVFPTTPSGKVDLKALPAPHSGRAEESYVGAFTALQAGLIRIWEEVLGIEKIGIRDNFFEIGGHSLKAIRVVSGIYKELHIKAELRDIFTYSTIERLSEILSKHEEIIYEQITPAALSSTYALSHAQQRLWVQDQIAGAGGAYNMPAGYIFNGALDIGILEWSFKILIGRHEILRTKFVIEGGVPVQVIQDEINFKLGYHDLQQNAYKSEEIASAATIGVSFNLQSGPLLQCDVFRTESQEYVLLFNMHHIISDGWSSEILIRELVTVYRMLSEGNEVSLPALRIQYKDYSAWEHRRLTAGLLDVSKAYWHSQLGELSSPLDLPLDYPRPSSKSYKGATLRTRIAGEALSALKAASQRHEVSLFMILTSVLKTLLYRYTGQQELTIGIPVAGRNHAELDHQIGFYVNTLAIRTSFKGEESFSKLLESVKERLLEGYEHQEYPFNQLVDELDLPRDLSRTPLFDVMAVYQDTGMTSEISGIKDIRIRAYPLEEQSSKFDLTFIFSEVSDELELAIEYNTDLFAASRINRMSAHYLQLASSAIKCPDESLNRLRYMSSAEEVELEKGYNEVIKYPNAQTLHSIFEEKVRAHPDAIAVVYNDRRLSYMEVNKKANQLAHYLREECGVQADELVGLKVHRSEWMIIGMLGILKSGGAYVPIDPDYPSDRVSYMLEDAALRVLLTEDEEQTAGDTTRKIGLLKQWEDISGYGEANPDEVNKSSDAAYVIYTSGSSGKPKGVVVEHRNVVSLLFAEGFHFEFTEKDVWTVFHSMCFDFSVWEIYGALLYGGRLVVVPSAATLNLGLYIDLLDREGVTVLNQVPTVFKNLLSELYQRAELPSFKFRYVMFGGEALNFASLRDWSNSYPDTRLFNLYGITETTVHVTIKEISKAAIEAGVSNIGVPLSSLNLYLTDEHQQLVPVGIVGEILVGGGGVARGYLNRPELTLQRFISNPYSSIGRLYRSGDLGIRQEDGNIIYKGRKDFQVKIRGHRIEIGEIEQVLLSHSGVSEVQVITVKEREDLSLAAYVVLGGGILIKELRSWLSERVPHYMVPSYFVEVSVFPTTPSGKVDLKALPAPHSGRAEESYVGAFTALQAGLIRIWEEVLGIEKIGIRDNFFEIGGHSLKAIRVVSGIYKELHIKAELRDIFTYSTIERLSEILSKHDEIIYEQITPAALSSTYALSHAQQRLWVQDQIAGAGGAYNMPAGYIFNGALDIGILEWSFKILIGRHEILRTKFVIEGGVPVQVIQDEINFKLGYHDLQQNAYKSEEIASAATIGVSFNLQSGPLLQCDVFRTESQEYVLLFNMHHIISDGWSSEILIRELVTVYRMLSEGNEVSLPALRIQYKDYSAWEHRRLTAGLLDVSKAYWHSQLGELSSPLDLPLDYPRPSSKSYKGATLRTRIAGEALSALKAASQRHEVSLFMILTSVLKTLLYRYTGQQELTIGIPVAGRNHAELDHQIGFYVNTLAIRTSFKGEESFSKLLESVKERLLEGYEHQEYPFNQLVDELDLPRDLSRTPLFDVMAVYQDTGMTSEISGIKDIRIRAYPLEEQSSKFDLTFIFSEVSDELELAIEYNTDLFAASRINRMSAHYLQLASSAIKCPDESLNMLRYMSSAEEVELEKGYNEVIKYPNAQTLHSIFEEKVRAHPDAIAVVYNDRRLSYMEVNKKANQLAHYLREECGVQADELVGLKVHRSEWMIIGMLGILKSGGAYVPIDPDYPSDRVSYMLEDAALRVLLTEDEEQTAGDTARKIGLLKQWEDISGYGEANPDEVNKSSDAAYVIYTSGSSGKPKGVVVEHRNVVSLLFAEGFHFEFTEKDVWTVFHSMCFDFSVWEIYGALLYGGRLVVVPSAATLNLGLYIDLLDREGVTVLNQVPTVFKNLLSELYQRAELPSFKFRYVMFGGEALNFASLRDWSNSYPDTRLFNLYGITETTVIVTFKEIHINDITIGASSIGIPLSSLTLYITDDHRQLVPIGIAGELLIGGAAVARGYLNRPELTMERFICNPLNEKERIYCSGDLGIRQEDGNIIYKGRKDFQVKIRGHRIEIGEIEQVLLSHSGVSEVQVITVKEGEDLSLAAYVVLGGGILIKELRSWLSERVPHYMVPSYFVEVSVFPTTPSGKVDLKALPAPHSGRAEESYVGAFTALQAGLIRIWEEVLGIEKIGIRDNFFEIGGHSLKAVNVVSHIFKEFNVKVELKNIFVNPTIEMLAEVIAGSSVKLFESIPVIEKQDYYEASHAQRRLWLLDQYQNEKLAYIIPFSKIIEGDFNPQVFIMSFNELIKRHEILRTTFLLKNGRVKQKIHDFEEYGFSFVCEDLRLINDQDSILEKYGRQELEEPFSLEKGPLLRARLFRLEEQKYLLMVSIHHIICDGWSMNIFTDEIFKRYNAINKNIVYELPELKIQYKDYSAWHNKKLDETEIEKSKNYWLQKLSGEITPITLFADFTQPDIETNKGATINMEFTHEETQGLYQISSKNGVSLFVTLLSVIKVLLYRYTYQNDIIIGTPSAGREHIDLHDQIGFYVNTLALRDFIYEDDRFTDVLEKVYHTSIDAFENQIYPYDILIEELGIKKENGKLSLFNVMVMLQNNKEAVVVDDTLRISENKHQQHNTSKFNLLVNFLEQNNTISLEVEYNCNYFKEERILRMLSALKNLISGIIRNPQESIGNYTLTDIDESVIDFL